MRSLQVDVTDRDLHLSCDDEVRAGDDMEFRAKRLSSAAAEQWTLCMAGGRPAIRLRHVTPVPLAYVLDRDGVLGMIFPSTVDAVRVRVAADEVGVSEWQFWIDDRLLLDRDLPEGVA